MHELQTQDRTIVNGMILLKHEYTDALLVNIVYNIR